MKVLVDTCVWSLALRKKTMPDELHVGELRKLISEVRVQMIGPIRQEILSGIKSQQQFEHLRQLLAAFPDMPVRTDDYELAARYFNLCRSKGIQGSNTDFLICAIATAHGLPIYTFDKDFELYKQHIPFELHNVQTV